MHDLTTMQMLYLLVPLAPLGGALVAGLLGGVVGRAGAHCAAILGVAIALAAARRAGVFGEAA